MNVKTMRFLVLFSFVLFSKTVETLSVHVILHFVKVHSPEFCMYF